MGDYHVRFCERLGVKLPLSTRHINVVGEFIEVKVGVSNTQKSSENGFWNLSKNENTVFRLWNPKIPSWTVLCLLKEAPVGEQLDAEFLFRHLFRSWCCGILGFRQGQSLILSR